MERSINDFAVEIRVTHCGVGRGDVDFIDGNYETSSMTNRPVVGGHEAVGRITAIGQQVEDFEVGQRVGVGFQLSSCGQCRYCQSQRQHLCASQQVQIADVPGALSGRVVGDHRFVFPIPESLSGSLAAPLLCAGSVMISASRQVAESGADKIGIIGIGGLGHLLVQLLAPRRHDVVLIDNKPRGPIDVCSPAEIEPASLDAIVVTSPDPQSFNDALRMTAPGGLVIQAGSPPKSMAVPVDYLNYQSERTVQGIYLGSPTDTRQALTLGASGDLVPMIETYPLSDLEIVLDRVRHTDVRYRAVVEFN